MKRVLALIFMMVLAVSLSSCADSSQEVDGSSLMPDTENEIAEQSMTEHYTTKTNIEDVINDPIFGDYGRLIFPVNSGYYGGSTLGNLSLTWYNYIESFYGGKNNVQRNAEKETAAFAGRVYSNLEE